MLMSNSRCWAEIDLSKIQHNVKEIRKMIPSSTKIMAIVKANAYGHGDIEVAKELQKQGVDFFGVSSVDEAIVLRHAGIRENILILGYTPLEHFHYLHELDILQTLLSKQYALELSEYCVKNKVEIRAHIKVDTGMSRLGVQCKEERWEIEDVLTMYRLPNIMVEGIFSHFSVSDSFDVNADREFTQKQIALYNRVLAEVKAQGIDTGITHLQNSYGIINYPELSYDYVRPGLLYLGVTSDDAIITKQKPDFQPIMTWLCNVSYVKTIEAGSCVSYGRHFTAEKTMKVATLSCGYADGYPRSVSNLGKTVLIHGKKAPIIGNVCMDQMMIDVSNIPDVKEGDRVILFGYDGDSILSVDELSRMCKTINNDMLCRVSARVPRIYIK